MTLFLRNQGLKENTCCLQLSTEFLLQRTMFRAICAILFLLLSTHVLGWRRILIHGVCPSKNPPKAKVGDSCGVPAFVDVAQFGDNKNTTGRMFVTPSTTGLKIDIRLFNLPRPDLVLTAWIIWVPFGQTKPPIFQVCTNQIHF